MPRLVQEIIADIQNNVLSRIRVVQIHKFTSSHITICNISLHRVSGTPFKHVQFDFNSIQIIPLPLLAIVAANHGIFDNL